MYFTKLDTFTIDTDLFEYKGPAGKSYPGLAPGIWLKYYHLSNRAMYNQHFPKFTDIVPDVVWLAEISGRGVLGPHIDHGPKVVLNWYMNSNDSETSFYIKNEGATGLIFPGETEPNIFFFNAVTKVDEFIAKDNEAYLLNVSKIHSVHSPNLGTRRFVTLGWNRNSYEEVLESIRLYREGN
jgi:hypothetical protein